MCVCSSNAVLLKPVHRLRELLFCSGSGMEATGRAPAKPGRAGILTVAFRQLDYSESHIPPLQNKRNYSVVPLRVIIKFNDIIYF